MVVTDRLVFIHVPKCAGFTVASALGGTTRNIQIHLPASKADIGERFSFGFVRNPWDRVVSLYHFLCHKTMKPRDNWDQPYVREIGFKRWLMEESLYIFADDSDHDLDLPMQRRTQMWWLQGVDYIGRFEALRTDFADVCQQQGIRPRTLGHSNRSKHAHYREYHDDETIAFVAQWFAPEIERFGYGY